MNDALFVGLTLLFFLVTLGLIYALDGLWKDPL